MNITVDVLSMYSGYYQLKKIYRYVQVQYLTIVRVEMYMYRV